MLWVPLRIQGGLPLEGEGSRVLGFALSLRPSPCGLGGGKGTGLLGTTEGPCSIGERRVELVTKNEGWRTELRTGDWVQLPDMPARKILSRRVGKVISADLGTSRVRVQVRGLPTEVVYIDAAELTRIEMYDEADDAAPFCGCGEPVTVEGQLCRWCRHQGYLEEFYHPVGSSEF